MKRVSQETLDALAAVTAENLSDLVERAKKIPLIEEAFGEDSHFFKEIRKLDEELQNKGTHVLSWMICYPRGNRKMLSCAQVRDYETGDWDLASKRLFPNTEEGKQECHEYMVTLAQKYNLRYQGETAYLD